jgi:hypothetical protein
VNIKHVTTCLSWKIGIRLGRHKVTKTSWRATKVSIIICKTARLP